MLPVCLGCGEFWKVGHECVLDSIVLHPLDAGWPADEVAELAQARADSEAMRNAFERSES